MPLRKLYKFASRPHAPAGREGTGQAGRSPSPRSLAGPHPLAGSGEGGPPATLPAPSPVARAMPGPVGPDYFTPRNISGGQSQGRTWSCAADGHLFGPNGCDYCGATA